MFKVIKPTKKHWKNQKTPVKNKLTPLKKLKMKLKNILKKKPINSTDFVAAALLPLKETMAAKHHSDCPI